MKNRILTFIIGLLSGAIITTIIFTLLIKNIVPQNMPQFNDGQMYRPQGEMNEPPEKPNGEMMEPNDMQGFMRK